MKDNAQMNELARVGAVIEAHDPVCWRAHYKIEKYVGDLNAADIARLGLAPYETVEGKGNLLMTAGATALWTKLIGGAGDAFSNANAYIGVGDSATAEAADQTDLQASTNKVRVAMESSYPQVSTNTVLFKSSFGSAVGNFAWAEWAVFNAAAAGTMLNRKVASNGTKASGSTWVFTVTLSLA